MNLKSYFRIFLTLSVILQAHFSEAAPSPSPTPKQHKIRFYYLSYLAHEDTKAVWMSDDGFVNVQIVGKKPCLGQSCVYKFKIDSHLLKKSKKLFSTLPTDLKTINAKVVHKGPIFYFGFLNSAHHMTELKISANNWSSQPTELFELRALAEEMMGEASGQQAFSRKKLPAEFPTWPKEFQKPSPDPLSI